MLVDGRRLIKDAKDRARLVEKDQSCLGWKERETERERAWHADASKRWRFLFLFLFLLLMALPRRKKS